MRLLADINAIQATVTGFQSSIHTGNLGLATWGAQAAQAEYKRLFPDTMVGMTRDQIVWQEAQQVEAAHNASQQSKATTGELVEKLTEDQARMSEISDALDACKAAGPTCAGDLGTQATVLAAKIQAETVLLESAKARAVEGRSDYELGARERAAAWHALNMQGYHTYGGGN
jgi:hypothetical protein